MAHAEPALPTDIFRRVLTNLAFRKAGDVGRNAVGNPMVHPAAAAALGIDHRDGEAFGASRRIEPRQLWRDVLTQTIRVLRKVRPAVGDPFGHHLAVLKGRRCQTENLVLRVRGAKRARERENYSGAQQPSAYRSVHNGSLASILVLAVTLLQ